MSILIKGMEMPKPGQIVLVEIDENGDVFAAYDGGRTKLTQHKSIPVPPHGRLIDADAVFKQLQKQAMSVWGNSNPRYQIILEVMDAIRFAPTILPAEEGET